MALNDLLDAAKSLDEKLLDKYAHLALPKQDSSKNPEALAMYARLAGYTGMGANFFAALHFSHLQTDHLQVAPSLLPFALLSGADLADSFIYQERKRTNKNTFFSGFRKATRLSLTAIGVIGSAVSTYLLYNDLSPDYFLTLGMSVDLLAVSSSFYLKGINSQKKRYRPTDLKK
ncbi:MAG: hypothetical protein WC595_02520 [Candidatus Nanoarchaeia archaeon]